MSGLSENTSGIDNYVVLKDHYKEPWKPWLKSTVEEQFSRIIH